MSTPTLAILGLVLLIGPGLVVLALDALDVWTWGVTRRETYSITTRELPNVAADIGTTDTSSSDIGTSDIGSSDTDPART
jgi:hypothetical protein